MQIELTEEQFYALLLMAGFAANSAFKEGDPQLAYRFIELTNEINKRNDIPAEFGGSHAGR